ncbi:MAG: hypothetical protein ACOCRK_03180 [bacterium]
MALINEIFALAGNAIIKRKKYADSLETLEATKSFDIYKAAFFNYDGISKKERDNIINNYQEKNNYYRLLNGYPPLGEEGIKLDPDTDLTGIDNDMYLHEMSESDLDVIIRVGILDDLIERYPDKTYLKSLKKRIPFIESRSADKFTLLGIFEVEDMDIEPFLKDTFMEMYEKNRHYFLRTNFNEYYFENYDYYELMMIFYLLFSTVITTIDELNEQLIDINILDEVDMNNLLKEYGVPNWGLPLSIKKKLVKVINTLVMNKGSKQTIVDIAKLFDLDNIYRYYLHKKLINYNFDEDTPSNEKYQLEFVRVPFGQKNIYECMQNRENIRDFQEFVYDDPRWGDRNTGDLLEDELLETDFSFMSTKYMSIENMIELTKLTFENSLFFQGFFNMDHISKHLYIRHDKLDAEVSLFELLVYETALCILRLGYDDLIPYESDKVSYVIGLNNEPDLKKLEHKFRVALANTEDQELLMLYDEIGRGKNIYEVMDDYAENVDIIKKIRQLMTQCDDIETYKLLQKVLDTMTIIGTNKRVYNDVDRYSEYLADNNEPLYNKYHELQYNNDMEKIRDEMRYVFELLKKELENISSANKKHFDFLDDHINEELDDLKSYLFKVIEFFKSHTNELKDYSVLYKIDDPFTRLHVLEDLTITEEFYQWEKVEYFLYGGMSKIETFNNKLGVYKDKHEIKEVLLEKDLYNSEGGFFAYD